MNGAVANWSRRGAAAVRRSGVLVGLRHRAPSPSSTSRSGRASRAPRSLTELEDMGSLLEAFGAQDLASPAGYLDGQVFAFMLPAAAVGRGDRH